MRIKLVLSLVAALPLLVEAGENKPPDGWKEVAGGYKKQAFTVWMPSDGKIVDVETSIVRGKIGQIRIFQTAWRGKDKFAFIASQINWPPQAIQEKLSVRQDYLRDELVAEMKGKLLEEKDVKVSGIVGKEYLVEGHERMVRFRILGTGVQFFRASCFGTKDQLASKDVEIFFGSFKRTLPKTAK